MSEFAGCTFSSTHLRISLERAAEAVALRLEVARHALDVGGQLGPGGLEPGDLLAQFLVRLGLQLGRRRLGRRDRGLRGLFGLGNDGRGLGLALPLGLVDELLSQQERSLQRLVAQRALVACGGSLFALRRLGRGALSRSSWAIRSLAWRSRSFS